MTYFFFCSCLTVSISHLYLNSVHLHIILFSRILEFFSITSLYILFPFSLCYNNHFHRFQNLYPCRAFKSQRHSRRLECRLHFCRWFYRKKNSFNFNPIFSIYEFRIFHKYILFAFFIFIFFGLMYFHSFRYLFWAKQKKNPNTPHLLQNNLLNFSCFSVIFLLIFSVSKHLFSILVVSLENTNLPGIIFQ